MQAIIKLAIKYRFNLPAYYTLLVRSLCSLEGLALRVDPEFSIVNAGIPILLRRLLTDTRPTAVNLLRELLLEDSKLRIGMLEGLLRNYSAEAGKAMRRRPSDNVVLKGMQPLVDGEPAYAVGNAPSRAALAIAGSISTWDEASGSGPVRGGLVSAAASAASQATTSMPSETLNTVATIDIRLDSRASPADATESTTGAVGSEEFASGTTVEAGPSDMPAHVFAETTGLAALEEDVAMQEEFVREGRGSVSALPSAVVDEPVPDATAGAEGSDEGSLVSQVALMVLSAKAAGVRRVLLEADMVVRCLLHWTRTMCLLMCTALVYASAMAIVFVPF